MGFRELEEWSRTECSKLASLDRGPINRNLELLSLKKSEWTEKHIRWANKTIGFIARMNNAEQGESVKDSEGRDCGSKRDISLKNWAFNPGKQRGLKKKDTHIRQTITDEALESSFTSRFDKIVAAAIVRQLTKYSGILKGKDNLEQAQSDLEEDFPSISSVGLTVRTYKDQLEKIGAFATRSFIEAAGEEPTEDVLRSLEGMLDARAEIMIKGWNNLDAVQRDRLLQVYSTDLEGYAGMDSETISEVNTIIRNGITDEKSVNEVTEELVEKIPDMSDNRAALIVNTEVNQSLAASRRLEFIEAGWLFHE